MSKVAAETQKSSLEWVCSSGRELSGLVLTLGLGDLLVIMDGNQINKALLNNEK